ncbi:MAG: hypothetical protein M0R03_18445 [Novosphingobium sp.]|nr:hypothetical protein [Novosphingobium sp.]
MKNFHLNYQNNNFSLHIFQIILIIGLIENIIKFYTVFPNKYFFLHHILWFGLFIYTMRQVFYKTIQKSEFQKLTYIFLLLPLSIRIIMLFFPSYPTKIDYFNLQSIKDIINIYFSFSIKSNVNLLLKIEIIISTLMSFLFFCFKFNSIKTALINSFKFYNVIFLLASLKILFIHTNLHPNIILFILFFSVSNFKKCKKNIYENLIVFIYILFFLLKMNFNLKIPDSILITLFSCNFFSFLNFKTKIEFKSFFYLIIISTIVFIPFNIELNIIATLQIILSHTLYFLIKNKIKNYINIALFITIIISNLLLLYSF